MLQCQEIFSQNSCLRSVDGTVTEREKSRRYHEKKGIKIEKEEVKRERGKLTIIQSKNLRQ